MGKRRAIGAVAAGLLLAASSARAEFLSYVYDAHGRLVATSQAASVGASSFSTYTYDAAHNRLSRFVAPVSGPTTADTLLANQSLVRAQTLTSANGQYRLALRTEGDLALFQVGGPTTPYWTSDTADGRAVSLLMNPGGTAELFGTGVVWSQNGPAGSFLRLRNDGCLLLLEPNGTTIAWRSSPSCL